MFVLRSRAFSFRPRIERRGGGLSLGTPWLVQLLTLFAYRRDVHVGAATQGIVVVERTFWFRRLVRVIRFRDVRRVTYSFERLRTSWDLFGRAHDQLELFAVGLELHGTGEVVPLARFVGEGARGDISTWLLGDDLVDFAGTQEDESRVLVTELCRRIGVGLGPDEHGALRRTGPEWLCGGCGRRVAPRPKCLYCGGDAKPG